jgi:hypothetical protein
MSQAKFNNDQQRAAAAAKKADRAREGAKAMQDYLAQQEATRVKTERLRAMRLAQESVQLAQENVQENAEEKPKPKRPKLNGQKPKG